MSRRAKCGHPSGVHKVKRYLTERGKYIWKCVDCPASFNAQFMLLNTMIRCARCESGFQATADKLAMGDEPTITVGTHIECLEPWCEERRERILEAERAAARELAINRLASKVGSKIRSESEQEDHPTISGLIQEDNS